MFLIDSLQPDKGKLCSGEAQIYNASSGPISKPNTAGVQSLVQYAAKNATAELNATG